MAVFKCSGCGFEVFKDSRTIQYKGKTKFKTYCGRVRRNVFMMKQK